jgi:hypothetical protein
MTLTVYSIDGVTPVVDPTAYVHPSAVLIGDVIVGPGCYIGPFASLRGDFGGIRVQAGANLQDCCIMHGFPGTDTVVEENGHIGHAAVLHSCVIRKYALVGMNAVVNDNAVIGEWRSSLTFRQMAWSCRRGWLTLARVARELPSKARMEGPVSPRRNHAGAACDDEGDVAAHRAGGSAGIVLEEMMPLHIFKERQR